MQGHSHGGLMFFVSVNIRFGIFEVFLGSCVEWWVAPMALSKSPAASGVVRFLSSHSFFLSSLCALRLSLLSSKYVLRMYVLPDVLFVTFAKTTAPRRTRSRSRRELRARR